MDNDVCNTVTGLCGKKSRPDGGGPDNVNLPPQCGNQRVEAGEQCDGNDLFGQSCQSRGFSGGTLKCTAQCSFDTSGCQKSASCGNGVIDVGEDCDGSNLNGQSCQSRGFDSGKLTCSGGCRFDTSACSKAPQCGNGTLDPGEQCDGSNLNNQNCQTQGFSGGTLGCTSGCRFDTSLCKQSATCGNGKIDAGEECDGSNLNNQSCQSKGFTGGSLRCTNGCRLDTSACTQAPTCGNGKIDAGEECDGTNLNNQSCQSKGFSGGNLVCSRNCKLDTSGCTQASKCGNQKVDAGEECDGTNFGSKTCKTQGFDSGTLKCNACKLDTSGCQRSSSKKPFGAVCKQSTDCASGPCIVRQGDATGFCSAECSATKKCPSSPTGATCLLRISQTRTVCGWSCSPGGSNTCPTGLSCQALGSGHVCLAGTPPPPPQCGNNKVEAGEACDGTNLNNQTCQTRGFTSGTLKCKSCQFDTSGCQGTPPVGNFGKPCQSAGSCGTGLICVTFAQNQSYCTKSCTSNSQCPSTPPGASCNISLQGGGKVCGWGTASGGPPICGNGVIDPGEDCDKSATRSTCKGLGYSGGTMKCSSSCKYVLSSCTGTTKCASLPPSHCTVNCKSIVNFLPAIGPGYRVRHGARLSWASRTNMISVKYASASVSCVYPGTKWLGLGDMSLQDGSTAADPNGRLRHPKGTHVNGNDMDIGYYQLNQRDNDLRPVCAHTLNGRDQYHCVQKPNILDATKSAFFIAKLLESNQVRVIGVDGKVGPMLKTAMQTLYNSGMISKLAYDLFNQGTVTWEETDKGRGWFRFHHHHLHVSYR